MQVQVNTAAPGYSPLESEQRITWPVEPAMAGKLRLLLLITEEWRDTPGAGAAAAAGELDLSADTLDAAKPKVVQTDLGLDTDTSTTGRFKDVEATIVEGQDLDVPTYIRKGIRIGI